MRGAWLWLGVMIVLALPSQVDAQHSRRDHSRGLNGAVERLYEDRESLGMTDAQLARVQEIKAGADSRKQPFWQQIMAVRHELKTRQKAEPDMPQAEKTALVERSGQEIERLLNEIRAIDHEAMREVGAVLTPQQKEMIMEMIRKHRRDDDRPDPDRGGGDSRD